jgi:hypothetical protein
VFGAGPDEIFRGSPDVAFGSRLCGNTLKPRMRRWFSQLPSPTEVASAIGFCIDEIETKILYASWALEYSTNRPELHETYGGRNFEFCPKQ